jgi:hypothetical protein
MTQFYIVQDIRHTAHPVIAALTTGVAIDRDVTIVSVGEPFTDYGNNGEIVRLL